ncbi:MAG: thioredoxin [Ruminococcus sp.]|nr:thioredoxin [Ruminococcus sp.]
MAEIVLTQDNFQEEVLNSDKPVLVDFWAAWCGPCQMLAPAIAEIASEHDDIKVGKVNVDDEPELARDYGVESIPMVVLFKDGKVADTSICFVPKERLEEML